MIKLSEVVEKSGLHPSRIQNVYIFGSQVYSTASEISDYDILIIAKTPYEEKELVIDNCNIHILTLDRFLEGLKQHHIGRLECLMSAQKWRLKEEINIPIIIKESGLRHSISHTVSNSWIKSKKKLEQGDYYLGIKSLFHSLRIAMFGLQIINHGKIVDFKCANYIWEELKSKTWNWEELNETFRPLRNKIMTDFRSVTNKL
jgi:predicted nucleotidyltransferase